MTLLSVVKDVCAAVGVQVPTSVFTNIAGNRTMTEMLSNANEMAQRIAYDERDWTRMRKTATFTGDCVSMAFNLPPDYKRMLLTSNVWRSTQTLYPMRFIPDTDEWLNRRNRNYYDAAGEWTMLGGQMLIAPVMDAGLPSWLNNTTYTVNTIAVDTADHSLWRVNVAHTSAIAGTFAADRVANPTFWLSSPHTTAYFPYLNKNCISLASGGTGDTFQSDGDSFPLDERVLKLGMIWQWKAQKGSPYSEDLGTYDTALSYLERNDSPAPIIVGRVTRSFAARTAYPFPVPTP